MIRLFLTTSLCFFGLLSSSAWSLNDYRNLDTETKGQFQNLAHHSLIWQSLLAEEEFEDDTKSRHYLPYNDHFQSSSFRVDKVVSLEDGRVLPPSNALKVFSLYHQFF